MNSQPDFLQNRMQSIFHAPLPDIPSIDSIEIIADDPARDLAASIGDIQVKRLDQAEIDSPVIQLLRKEINLDTHHQIDPHFMEHEKKEIN